MKESETPPDRLGPSEGAEGLLKCPNPLIGAAPIATAQLLRPLVNVPALSDLVDATAVLSVEDRSKLKLFSTRLTRAIAKVEQQEAENDLPSVLESVRLGLTLDLDNLRNQQLNARLKKLIRPYKDNINEFGPDALAHLGLGYQSFRRLLHEGIRTIPQLRQEIRERTDLYSILQQSEASWVFTAPSGPLADDLR